MDGHTCIIFQRMTDLQAELNQCLFHASSALHRWLGKLAEEQFKAVELTPTQGFILIVLKQAPGATISDLARVLQLDSTTVTKTLDRMKDKGLVLRENNGRTVEVFATDHGIKKEADAMAAWKKLKLGYGKITGAAHARAVAGSVEVVLEDLRNFMSE
jgi:DNA-binding MarR family transcriptional regulator